MTDVGVQEHHKAIIDQMQNDRGWIVNSFAQVEFLLADTVVRCRAFGDYAEMAAKIPYRLDQRVTRFEAMIEADGPLSENREALRTVVENFRSAEERRQFLVHGFCAFFHTPAGDTAMRFDRFMPTKDDDSAKKSMWFRPDTLKQIREQVVAETAFALDTFRAVHIRLGWGDPA